jgi:hypothetical protein
MSKIDLSEHEFKVYSQNGEDGVIEKIFEVIGTTNKYYVEFGVEDSTECNTRYLRKKKGWKGLMMDGGYYRPEINLQQEFITAENINSLFDKHNVPHKFDLLSVDLDYNDLYVLYSILKKSKYKPRVIIAEYNASLPYDEDKTVIYNPTYMWDRTDYSSASIYSYYKLLKDFNYSIVYGEKKGVNLFAIHNDIHKDRFKNTNNIKELYKPPKYGFWKGPHKKDYFKRPYMTYEYLKKHGTKYILEIYDDIQKILNEKKNTMDKIKEFIKKKKWDELDEIRKELMRYVNKKLNPYDSVNKKKIIYTLTIGITL